MALRRKACSTLSRRRIRKRTPSRRPATRPRHGLTSWWVHEQQEEQSMTTDPPTMQAIIQDGYGPPERVLRLDQSARPSTGADDVLLRVRATSVNTPDWATVAGVPYVFRL